MSIVKEKFTDIWKRREPLYLKENTPYDFNINEE